MSNVPQQTSNATELAEAEPSVGELVTAALDDISTLVKHELELAKAELTFSVKNGGLAAGLFGAAAFLLLMGVIMLSVAVAYLIHLTGLDLAWCFLIVWGAYTALAALLAVIGWTRVKFVRPPKRAIEQAKETKTALVSRG
ncbi:MAG TPA: phage holin family protein [Nocardioidaceae bacterium]|nr:phage holin family protein [Nocardioidaceae bacterium]